MSYRRQSTCSHCYVKGHNRRSCPNLRQQAQNAASKPANERTWDEQSAIERITEYNSNNRACSYCSGAGHNFKTCSIRKDDFEKVIVRIVSFRQKFIQALKANNFGVGAIVSYDGYFSGAGYPQPNENGEQTCHYLIVQSFFEHEITPWNCYNKRSKLHSCVRAKNLQDLGGQDYRSIGNINLPSEVISSIDNTYAPSSSMCAVLPVSGSPITGIDEEKFVSWEYCRKVGVAIFDSKDTKKKIASRGMLVSLGVVTD
jgi:hypothetical protein